MFIGEQVNSKEVIYFEKFIYGITGYKKLRHFALNTAQTGKKAASHSGFYR